MILGQERQDGSGDARRESGNATDPRRRVIGGNKEPSEDGSTTWQILMIFGKIRRANAVGAHRK